LRFPVGRERSHIHRLPYVYRAGILQAQYSFTTAVGLFQSVIGLVLVMTFNKLSGFVSENGGLW